IEIIPGTGAEWQAQFPDNQHHPFLLSEGHFGIPEKILYHSFAEVVRVYPSFRRIEALDSDDALLASSVILFANSDHNSAFNFHKRMILEGRLDEPSELAYIKLLAMIPKNSKSSLLWHHRRWVLERLFPATPLDGDDSEWHVHLPVDTCEEEVLIVTRACQSYRRNYLAWAHRSFVLQQMRKRCLTDVGSEYKSLFSKEYQNMTSWMESHISDHSAAQYLCQLQRAMEELNLHPVGAMTLPSPVGYFVELIQTYPDHETLWLGLR
ncbi:protein prenylyltransferase, partial [Calocera viscosa TUFC12733]